MNKENISGTTQKQLPEFSREIPSEEQLTLLSEKIAANRRKLLTMAGDWGLDTEFLLKQQEKFLIGPFVSPAPLPTTFAGRVDNFRCSLVVGSKLVMRLVELGFRARQALVVPLAWTEIPRGGVEAMDCLILPKNKLENKRELLVTKPAKNQPYESVVTDSAVIGSTIKSIQDSFLQFLERYPILRRKTLNAGIIKQAIVEDLETALGASQAIRYLEFAGRLNRLIAERVIPGINLPIVNVDIEYYDPFFRYGITDVVKFTRNLEAFRFFEGNPGFIKTMINGKVQILRLENIDKGNVALRFSDEYSEDDKIITFSNLIDSQKPISPCKDLSYLICFSNMTSVVYGSQNSGEYYRPYAMAIQLVKAFGLDPVIYRIQPQISDGYLKIDTVFDFYRDLLITGAL